MQSGDTQETSPPFPHGAACPRGIWGGLCRFWLRPGSARWVMLGILAGVFSGLAAIGFYLGVEALQSLLLTRLAGADVPAPSGESLFHFPQGPSRNWLIPVFTTAVGLLTGWLVERFIPQTKAAGTDGTDAMIKAFHQQAGVIAPRVPLIKGLTSILTIASGGSAGREGPISQIGAGVGSWLAGKMGLSPRERRILLLAGAAGGLGAIFRAPLGGALTAVEVLYREDFEAEAVLPAVISSVVAYSLFALAFGTQPILNVPSFAFSNPLELPFYALLAVACSGAGWLFLSCFFHCKYRIFAPLRQRVGATLACGLGGLGMGLLGWAFPQVLSGGYGWLELAVGGGLPVLLMLAIVLGKILATSVTIGSGMSGGMFAPSLFIGGMTGGVVGQAAHALFPTLVTQPGGYVLVGMAAFFSGVAGAAVGPVVMVCELTQGYGLLAPLMLASVLCVTLSHGRRLYENQLQNKFKSPAHSQDATINVLETLRVQDYYRRRRTPILEESTTLAAIADVIVNTSDTNFPVRNTAGELTGIVVVTDVRRVLFENSLFDLVVARDIARKPVRVTPEDDLYKALLLFVDSDYNQIPVVSQDDPNAIQGALFREDVFKAYSTAVHATDD